MNLMDTKRFWLRRLPGFGYLRSLKQMGELRLWSSNGNPPPPPDAVKQSLVRQFGERYSLTTFIETGTYLGDMLWAMKDSFAQLISIEIDPIFFENACKRFVKYRNIELFLGDSGHVLPEILCKIHGPCLFWLDGHYDGGKALRGKEVTPILKEMNTILSHSSPRHVILIDDARLFCGMNDYPMFEDLEQFMRARRPDLSIQVKHDVICVAGRSKI